MGGVVTALAGTHAERAAVIEPGRTLTYRDLDRASAEMASGLLALGVSKGSRVGILLPNGVDWLVSFAAVTRVGGVAMPISTLATARELHWLLDAGCVGHLVCAPRYRSHDYLERLETALPSLKRASGTEPLFLPEAPHLRRIVVLGDQGNGRTWASAQPGPVDDDVRAAAEARVHAGDPVVVIHTSGSTAEPKGVVHAHGRFLGHTCRMSEEYALPSAGDHFCSTRPWFWVAGLAADLFYQLHAGATFIVPSDTDSATILGLIEDVGIDFVGGPYPWFRQLDASSELSSAGYACLPLGIDLAGIARVEPARSTSFTSAALESKVPATAAADFEPARFPNLFGMTETLGTHSGLPHGTQVDPRRAGTSGPPVPGVERRVIDPTTGHEVAPGEEGELNVRGESLMLGLDRRTLRATFDPDGWYATGDLCRVDADGWITFRGRLGDMVKISGANVSPLEVQQVLGGHPAVQESVVVGVSEGETVVLTAVVVPVAGATVDGDVMAGWLGERLSSYKVPRRVVCMTADELPRTSSGKVRTGELAALLASGHEPAGGAS